MKSLLQHTDTIVILAGLAVLLVSVAFFRRVPHSKKRPFVTEEHLDPLA